MRVQPETSTRGCRLLAWDCRQPCWSVAPFFTINLLARRWTGLRAKATWAFCAAMMASITLQGLYTMFIIDPRKDSAGMFFVMPFFTYIAMIPFLVAAYVFHPSDD